MPRSHLQASVIVASDRCASGEEQDVSGVYLRGALTEYGFLCEAPRVVSDDYERIKGAIAQELAAGSRLIVTAGGTGVSPRDVTPEAATAFITTRLPGVEQLLLQASLAETPYAAFSRGVAGLTGAQPRALIVAVPGSKNAAVTAARTLFPLLDHLFAEMDRLVAPEGKYSDHYSH